MSVMPAAFRPFAYLGATDQILAGMAALAVLAMLTLAARAGWRCLRKRRTDDLLTVLAASLTSAVVATGMWHFAGERLHFSGVERWLLFAILEVTVVTCAVRARRNIEETGSAGPEGVAIWLVSIMSGVFAATVTTSAPEALFRLLLPLLATWLWERSLLPTRRAANKQSRWHAWAERFLARLGIGALDLTADEDAAARWRIAQLARAVVRAKRATRVTARWRRWRVDVLTVAANERAELATRADRRDLLLAYIGVLHATDALIAVTPAVPWADAKQDASSASETVTENAPEIAPEATPEAATQVRPERAAGALPKLTAKRARGMSPAALVPYAAALLKDVPDVSLRRAASELHVGVPKATEALRLARRSLPTPIRSRQAMGG